MSNFQRGYSEHDADDVAYHRFVTLTDADAKAQRAFWRGLVIGGVLSGLGFVAAFLWLVGVMWGSV